MEGCQQHREATLKAIGNLYDDYKSGSAAALRTDGAAFAGIEQALEKCGELRLFKYQPFTERNLMDCSSGVLHLTPLTKLNDINEGFHRFDAQYAVSCLCGVVPERISQIDFEAMPSYVRGLACEENLQGFVNTISEMKDSGKLQSCAPMLAQALEVSFRGMRERQLCGSLSETVRSASMWDRYACGHRGFAAGYKISSFSSDLTRSRDATCTLGFKALIAPVFYGDRLEMTTLASVSQIRDPFSLQATNISSLMLVMSLLQKAREWEHEAEWRAVANACPNGVGVQYCRIRPDSIYLGVDMQEDEHNRAVEVARLNKWDIFQMKRSEESSDWALEAKQIE